MLSLLNILVAEGIFKKIKFCLLPKGLSTCHCMIIVVRAQIDTIVGHTHGPIDGMFGKFSDPIYQSDIYTLEDIERVCKAAFHADDDVEPLLFHHLDTMGSFSTTIGSYLKVKLKGITKPRMFEIQRDQAGHIRTRYRLQLQVRDPRAPDSWDHLCDSDGEEVDPEVPVGKPKDRWMPHNGPHKLGLELFPLDSGGPPLILSNNAIQVPSILALSLSHSNPQLDESGPRVPS